MEDRPTDLVWGARRPRYVGAGSQATSRVDGATADSGAPPTLVSSEPYGVGADPTNFAAALADANVPLISSKPYGPAAAGNDNATSAGDAAKIAAAVKGGDPAAIATCLNAKPARGQDPAATQAKDQTASAKDPAAPATSTSNDPAAPATAKGPAAAKDPAADPEKKGLPQETLDKLQNDIFKARDGIGTDDKAINAALRQCKTQADIDRLNEAYKHAHDGHTLDDDIKDKQSKALLHPDDPGSRQTAAVEALKDARSLFSSTDPEKVHAALEGLKPEERKAVMDKYKEETGSSLEDQSKASAVAAGAAKGAMIGSLIPVIGTVVGGLVGGAIGAMQGEKSADADNKAIEDIVKGGKDSEANYRKDVIEKELHGGVFGSGGFLGLGIGRDTEKIDRMIETASPEDKKKLTAAVGADVTQSLSGDDQKLAKALLADNKAAADAVRIHQSDGIFTNDKEKAFAQMEGKSAAERDQMQKQFKALYGTDATTFMTKEFGAGSNDAEAARQLADTSGYHKTQAEVQSLQQRLKDNPNDADAKKSLEAKQKELAGADKGHMDPAFELKYAMDGFGTDMKRMKEALAGKSPDEINKIKKDYEKLTHHTLEEDMAGETKLHSTSWIPGYDLIKNGGMPSDSREGLEIKQMLRGDPSKIADPAERARVEMLNAKEDHDFERGSGRGLLDKGVDLVSFGKLHSFTDIYSDAGKEMDAHYARQLKDAGVDDKAVGTGSAAELAAYKKLAADKDKMKDFEQLSKYEKDDRDNTRAVKDQASNAAAMTATLVVATATTAATGGAAGAAWAAVLGGLAGGGAGMLTKAAMQGQGYNDFDMLKDAGEALLQAGAGGLSQSARLAGLLGKISSNKVAMEAMKMAVMGGVNRAGGALLDEEAWRNGHVGVDMLKGLGLGMAGGAVSGGIMGGFGEGMANKAMAGVIGGGMGGVAESAIDPATWEGDPSKILAQKVLSNVAGAMIGGFAGGHGSGAPHENAVPVEPGRPVSPVDPHAPTPVQPAAVDPLAPTVRAPVEPVPAELPPVDDGHNWGERAFAQAEREALAKMDPERFGHMVEGPESASAAEHQPAARPADEPAAAFHEKDAMRLEGEEEYLRQENEAAERARAARAAAAPPATADQPAPVTERSPVGPEHLRAREPQVEVVSKPASPADTERAPAIKVPREEHYWGPVMPEGEPGFAPESATPSQMAPTEMPATEMAPTEKAPAPRAFEGPMSPEQKEAFRGPGPDRAIPDQADVARIVNKARANTEPLTPAEADLLMKQVAYGGRKAIWETHLENAARNGAEAYQKALYTDIFTPEHLGGYCGEGQAATAYHLQELVPGAQINPIHTGQAFGPGAASHSIVIAELPGGQRFLIDTTVAQFYNPEAVGKNGAGQVGLRTTTEGMPVMDQLKTTGYLPLDENTARIYGEVVAGRQGLRPEDYIPSAENNVQKRELDFQRDKLKLPKVELQTADWAKQNGVPHYGASDPLPSFPLD